MSLAAWLLVALVTNAVHSLSQGDPSTALPGDNLSPHVVAKFPPVVGSGGRFGGFNSLELNKTREGPLIFNHLTIDRKEGRLYAGAVNRLLQLDYNLRLEQYVSTGETIFTIVFVRIIYLFIFHSFAAQL